MTVVLGLALLLMSPAPIQEKAPAAKSALQGRENRPCSNQPDPQICERGWQLLDNAEAEVSASRESGVRAFGQWRVARAYAVHDKRKAVALLNTGFRATLSLPEGNIETLQGKIEAAEKGELQRRILEDLATLAPEEAEDKLSLATPSIREPVFAALVGYYQRNELFDSAVETIIRIARDAGFPYMAANRLLGVLPPERDAQRQQLFAAALSGFRTHPPKGSGLGFDAGAFPQLIVQNWRRLPPAMIREAIDEVLRQAKKDADDSQPTSIVVGYVRGGGASLHSIYEYRLFQLLPVLRQIDPDAADSLLRDHQVVAKQFEAYIQAGSPTINYARSGPSTSGVRRFRSDMRSPVPGESPQDVVQRVMSVEDVASRAGLLLAVARREQVSNTSVAKACLDKLIDPVAAQVPSLDDRFSMLAEGASLYLNMKEDAGASKAIVAAKAAADKLYLADNDASDPNRALKPFWPSTSAYITVVRLASRVSQDLGLKVIAEATDEEVRPLMRLALAEGYIGVSMGWLTTISKDGTSSQHNDPESNR